MSTKEEHENMHFRHRVYRPPTRTDPWDGKPYTWKKLADWYSTKGWTMQDINAYWETLETHAMGRTRTRKKEVLPEEDPRVKKRKQDAAKGSTWERW